ncbi:putative membrane protein (OPT superfamily) [Methanocella conradii HZ254]|uniref:Membrane protein (OPT superfamily) n=1 Tax=Methanocella conradii (strain DSM 24694 / JCM 17849 / CGMCC 1.5162 / HZ254) TaxID=1041930 RepID=H8I690_METCZ|nr:OPT/YSL family transporter [Methanocella conradii]AFD00737.1 putative membrane protein (OPT superfamily) [Methanocella conradii HZ254]
MKKGIAVVAIGVAFSMANAFVSMYLGMKTGFGEGIAVLLLFAAFMLFTALGVKSRSRSLICVSAIIMGSTGVAISYTDGLGAIIMSGEPFPVPGYAMVAILMLSGVIGILMASHFSGYFLKGDFPWPGSRAMASLISMLTAEKREASRRLSAIRMGAAGVFSGAIAALKGVGMLPEAVGSINIGIGLSPMMAGIGMLIGWRACTQIAIGALASLLILVFIENPGIDYSSHMKSPWIFSTAISMMVTTALITLYFVIKPAISSIRGQKNGALAPDGGAMRAGIAWMSRSNVALIIAILCAAILMVAYPGVPIWVFLVCMPAALIFMIIETRGKAEMGMSVGMSSFVILLIVGLAFDDIVPLLVLEGFVVSTILTFSLTFSILKQSEFCGVDAKGLSAMALVGVVAGSVICVPFLDFFNDLYGIGTSSLPAPYSVMWLEMAGSAVAGAMPPSISLYLILAGSAIALVFYRYRISAVTVAIGLLLPVSTSAAIIAGGIIAWAAEKKGALKDDGGITASGLMVGDIVVNILSSLRYL